MRLPWVRRAPLEAQLIRLETAHAQQLAEGRAVNQRLQKAYDDGRIRAATAEEVARLVSGVADRLTQELTSERKRYHELVDQVIAMRRDDFSIPREVPAMPERAQQPTIPAEVMAAVVLVSDPNSKERRNVELRVRDLMASGMPPQQIADALLQGEDVEA